MPFIFTLLILTPIMYPVNWTGNEFNYFGIAKHNIAPSPYSSLYASYNGQLSRIFADYTIGLFIEFFGFDNAWTILRLIGLFFISAAYAYFTTKLELFLPSAIVALLLFKKLGQTYFGAEWLFNDIEPKVFAYIFVFFGLAFATINKQSITIIFLSLATYFHFLVGGFWGIATFVYIYLNCQSGKQNFYYFKYFILAITPVFALLVYENLRLPPPDISGLGYSVDQIYSTIRAPHHVAPFDGDNIRENWGNGFVFIIFNTFILSILYYFNFLERKPFVLWILLLHAYLLLAFLLAYFDRNTQYLGKLYLFRPASLILLLTLLIYCDLAFDYLLKLKIPQSVFTLILLLIVSRSVYKNMTLNSFLHITPLLNTLSDDEKKVSNWLNEHTQTSDVILFDEGDNEKLTTENFEQLVNRPSLVNWKFVPTTKYAIARWYRLMLLKRKAFSGDCSAFASLPAKYYISYSEASYKNVSHCSRTVFSKGKYNITFYEPTVNEPAL